MRELARLVKRCEKLRLMLFLAKVERSPARWGLALGFVLLPLLDIAQESVVRLATDFGGLQRGEILDFFAADALSGAVLGAGILSAWVAWRRGEQTRARVNCGAAGFLVFGVMTGLALGQGIWGGASGFTVNGMLAVPAAFGPLFGLITGRNVAFYGAIAALLWAILSSSKR